MKWFVLGASTVSVAVAQQGAWAQCGGIGFTGPTTCVSGYTCKYSNDWYSQCVPGTATSTLATSTKPGTTSTSVVKTTTVKPTTTKSTSVKPTSTVKPTTTVVTSTKTTSSVAAPTGTKGKFKWLGVNESGAEFGQGTLPGTWGKDFTFASTTSIDTLMSQGFNIFRLPFMMERMVPTTMTGGLAADYLANYTAVVNHITSAGGYAVIDPHNFGRYYSAIITSSSDFQTFWHTLATPFAANPNVIFDTNNEYHDMDQTLVLNLNQAAINGIRAAGATSQFIFVEGNSYSGAYTWNVTNTNLAALSDPQDKLVYEMHQYLDSDNSGTSTVCVSSTIGAERVSGATAWLRANGKVGIIGEFAGGANEQCASAVTGMLDALRAAGDVWLGAMWWGGGPWWGDYIYGFEPPTSTGYNYYDATLQKYTP